MHPISPYRESPRSRVLSEELSGSQRQGLSFPTQGSDDCVTDTDSTWCWMPVIRGWTGGKCSPTHREAFQEHAQEGSGLHHTKSNEAVFSLSVETLNTPGSLLQSGTVNSSALFKLLSICSPL